MDANDWVWIILLVGGFAAVTEHSIRKSEERVMQKLDRMHEHIIGLCNALGVDPIHPLD